MKTKTIGQCKDCKYAGFESKYTAICVYSGATKDLVVQKTYGCWYWKEKKK